MKILIFVFLLIELTQGLPITHTSNSPAKRWKNTPKRTGSRSQVLNNRGKWQPKQPKTWKPKVKKLPTIQTYGDSPPEKIVIPKSAMMSDKLTDDQRKNKIKQMLFDRLKATRSVLQTQSSNSTSKPDNNDVQTANNFAQQTYQNLLMMKQALSKIDHWKNNYVQKNLVKLSSDMQKVVDTLRVAVILKPSKLKLVTKVTFQNFVKLKLLTLTNQ